MKGKYIVIVLLLALLGLTVYQMMKIETSLREERTVELIIEDESKPLISKLSAEDLQKAASVSDYYFMIRDDYFQKLDVKYFEGEKILYWNEMFLKGVNLGVAVPGKFPAEFSLSFSEYLEWLIMIGKMNANTIRTYTILPPAFYEAFSYYNLHHHDHPLYLMQGVWATIPPDKNYYDPSYMRDFQKEITDMIDVIQGDAVIQKKPGKASGTYAANISKYVVAYLLGREWEPDAVFNTNQVNDRDHFTGDFICMNSGNAMEAWLAEMMDFAILYETQSYKYQHPVSFVNWLPLDPMYHNTEIIENKKVREHDNDLESIDFMRFHATKYFFPGLFAAYHAYPYYPDFIYLQESYQNTLNHKRLFDPYYGYLLDLKQHNQGMPLIIAEYGLPSSRGLSHFSPYGFHQGGHSEEDQAILSVEMTQNIVNSGCAGAIYFEWIDEWFKHNWLVMDFELPFENRKLWHNMENPEQNFGILALESRTKGIDGNLKDWEFKELETEKISMKADADAGYFYLSAVLPGIDLADADVYIAIDSYDEEKGDHRLPFTDKIFNNGFEFLVELRSADSAWIFVDEPYSVFTDIYNDHVPVYASEKNSNGNFVHQLMLTNRGRTSLLDEETDSVIVDRSPLIFGCSSEPEYSNADWFYDHSNNILELRLDWHLLNVSDPSGHFVLDDKKGTGVIEYSKTDEFNIFLFVVNKTDGSIIQFPQEEAFSFIWDEWENPTYNQRLKPVYYSLQDFFKDLEPEDTPNILRSGIGKKFEIADFYENRPGAVSISFDNAGFSQYEYALPVLEKYKLSAGFAVIPGMMDDEAGLYELNEGIRLKRLGLSQLEKIAGNNKICLQLKSESAIPSYSDVKSIESKTNSQIETLHLDESGLDISHIPAIFVREIGVEDPLMGSYDEIDYSVLDFDISRSELDSLLKINRNAWTIVNYLHLYDENEGIPAHTREKIPHEFFIERSDFDKQIRLIRNSGYWIAPESDIFKYLKEKQNSKIQFKEFQDFIFLEIVNELDNGIYDQPLTIKYYTTARKIRISSSLMNEVYTNRTGMIQFSALPNEQITIELLVK